MAMNTINSFRSVNQLNRVNAVYNNSLQKIGSGSKYPSAANGASAYSILVRLNSNVGAISQSKDNTQTTNAMLATAAGGVSSTISSLSSLREQILKAANGTNNNSDISAISNDINQTIATIDENASIEFNGMQILRGGQSYVTAGVNGNKVNSIDDLSAKGLGLVDENGKSLINLSSREGIANSLSIVDGALDKALDQAATIGAAQQNLSYSATNYITQGENMLSAASSMGDTDIAAEITNMKNAETLQQIALFATKMYMHQNASVLGLLR